MVAKAIEILLITYSNAIKIGSYYKKTKSEKVSSSGVSKINIPISKKSTAGIYTSGKSVKREPETSNENEPYNRSNVSTSDSDISFDSGTKKIDSRNVDSSAGNLDIGHFVEFKAAGAVALRTGQALRSGDVHLNSCASGLQETQETSAEISHADLHSYVFAPVEEEMAGDGSYLLSVIIEFLRRCTDILPSIQNR